MGPNGIHLSPSSPDRVFGFGVTPTGGGRNKFMIRGVLGCTRPTWNPLLPLKAGLHGSQGVMW